jgi:glycosyltransferase involved in cell wall biosynthesis
MSERPLLCGFLKVRNEIIREQNLYRVLENMSRYCDAAVVCDDASSDGTREYLIQWIAERQERGPQPSWWRFLGVDPSTQDFRKELYWKQKMLDEVHVIEPHFVLWMDGDEVFDAQGTKHLPAFCESVKNSVGRAWRFHYTQFWRNTFYARTDGGFDDGWFLKLWKWSPDLSFAISDGTHQAQFPVQVGNAIAVGLVHDGPFEQLHYGNFGTNLRWKVIQYRGGLGGWERHLVFKAASFRAVAQSIIPDHCESFEIRPDSASPTILPFTDVEEARIRDLYNLKQREGYFSVIIPAYNRAADLPRALDSLLKQTYEKWIAIVLDDGSTDHTPAVMRQWQDIDPRIFYCRYPKNRGGVAMNEIGMALACEMTEWWTRLGSDDFFGPRKLELDATALRVHEAVYGMYHVHREGKFYEICNPPCPSAAIRNSLLTSGFACSWANCAARTSVLRRVRDTYGSFCDPALRNMEDFLVNARIARESSGWVWRGMVDGKFILNPDPKTCVEIAQRFKRGEDRDFEAAWNAVESGASGNSVQTTRDENTTRQLIMQENIKRRRGG